MQMLKIPFGIRDGRVAHPSEVPRGLACNCTCPGCGARLIAKHPKEKVSHFAHYHAEACAAGYESALHKAAKQVLSDRLEIFVPGISASAFVSDRDTNTSASIARSIKSSTIKLDEVVQESREYDGVIPDIVAKANGRILFIEIAVTHFVDGEKLKRLKAIGHPVLEIALDPTVELPTLDQLAASVINEPSNRTWLVNPRKDALFAEVKAEAERELQTKVAAALKERAREKRRREAFLDSGEGGELHAILEYHGIDLYDLFPYIGWSVAGEKSFPRSTFFWQAYVYRRFIHGCVGYQFDAKAVADFLRMEFKVTPPFPNAEKVAIYKYLEKLVGLELLSRPYGQQFNVRKDVNGDGRPF